MPFDQDVLRRDLDALPWKHRVAFAAACCERLLPNYFAFAREVGWGKPAVLRAALDYVWNVLDDARIDRGEVHRLVDLCDGVIPDTEDFETSSASSALDAGTAVVGTLRSLLDHDSNHVVEVASYCRDTVHMYIRDRDDLDGNEPLLEMRIEQDPLMIRELARQAATLAELRNRPDLDRAFLRRLRDESADEGRSNIGRTA